MLSPYQQAVSGYLMAGWIPFPLPKESKKMPPVGITGEDGINPSEEQYEEWMSHDGNVGLRMGETMIGIDIDREKGTGERIGFATFKALEKKLGALPIEFVMSNQEHLASGFTAFFKVPTGIDWKSGAGKKIDILHHKYRYQVAAPSIHPDGPVYEWRAWHGGHKLSFIPDADSMPELPAAWIEYLTKKPVEASVSASNNSDDEPVESVAVSLSGASCALMRSIVATRISKLKYLEVSRHDFMVATTFAIIAEAFKGHSGGEQALSTFKSSWVILFTDDELKGRDLDEEYYKAVVSAKNKMIGMQRTGCGCGRKKTNTYKKTFRTSASLKMWR